MISPQLVVANLTNPAVLCFIIGALAAFLKSDLRVPPQAHETISMYLLLAIGLKGGLSLSHAALADMLPAMAATLALGMITPVVAYNVARRFGKLDVVNSAALAAHFGSVSAVTFMAALNFATRSGIAYEGFMTALLVMLEIPGIVLALALAGFFAPTTAQMPKVPFGKVLHEALTGKSIILLSGGVCIGLLGDAASVPVLKSVFVDPFQGILVFFLLEMGVVAASRFKEVRSSMRFMLTFGTLLPLLFGMLGALAGHFAGLSEGGTAILATMAASASYIAAPAAVRMALPAANPGLYLTVAISITLPFNIVVGIPIYFSLAQYLAKLHG